jgi:pyruvate dehydrogenase E2 component (dihydrolipoamide acetyltransferase)
MPQMGESIAEGTIVRWIKKVGDSVDRDEPLFEISTDKVDAEIPSPAAGTLLEITVKEGETVPVNSVVAKIGAAGRTAADGQSGDACAARRRHTGENAIQPRTRGASRRGRA